MNGSYSEAVDAGVARVINSLNICADLPSKPSFEECIRSLNFPKSCEWINQLKAESWSIIHDNGNLDIRADTNAGYLTIFIVND